MSKTWALSSSDGWNRLSGTFLKSLRLPQDTEALLTDITILGRYWRRDAFETGVYSTEMAVDFEVKLPQMIFIRDDMINFYDEVDSWLSHYQDFRFEFSTIKGQQFSVQLGVDEMRISKADHPVCKIQCSSERLNDLDVKFVVDQSCIALMRDDLRIALGLLN